MDHYGDPGSHNKGVLTENEIGAITNTQASAECVVPAGDAADEALIIHASSKSQTKKTPRRILSH